MTEIGHDRNFNYIITTIFHELDHFSDSFDLGKYFSEFEVNPSNITLEIQSL